MGKKLLVGVVLAVVVSVILGSYGGYYLAKKQIRIDKKKIVEEQAKQMLESLSNKLVNTEARVMLEDDCRAFAAAGYLIVDPGGTRRICGAFTPDGLRLVSLCAC